MNYRHLVIMTVALACTCIAGAQTSKIVEISDFPNVIANYNPQNPSGTCDTTQSLQSAIDYCAAIGASLHIGAGNYLIDLDSIHIKSPIKILTDGMNTAFFRGSKQHSNLPMISIECGDVEIGSFQVIGNIAGDTGESCHGCQIAGPGTNGNGMISRVKLGDIFGTNIRGDVLYTNSSPTGIVRDITFGNISGINILRSICSIAGGDNITGNSVIGGNCGYSTLDLEPNANSTLPVGDVHINYVQGGKIGLQGTDGDNNVGNVKIDTLFLDSAMEVPPSPPYQNGSGGSYFDLDVGISATNFKSLTIGSYFAKGKTWSALYSGSPTPGPNSQALLFGVVTIDHYEGIGNGAKEAKAEFWCPGIKTLKIASGSSSLAQVGLNSIFISNTGNTNNPNFKIDISNMNVNGRMIGGTGNRIHNVITTYSDQTEIAYDGMINPLISGCVINGGERGLNQCVHAVLVNCTSTAKWLDYNSGDMYLINTTDNGVLYPSGPRNGGGATGYEHPINLGPFNLWVDSTGHLRINNGSPVSDLAGQVVGKY